MVPTLASVGSVANFPFLPMLYISICLPLFTLLASLPIVHLSFDLQSYLPSRWCVEFQFLYLMDVHRELFKVDDEFGKAMFGDGHRFAPVKMHYFGP